MIKLHTLGQLIFVLPITLLLGTLVLGCATTTLSAPEGYNDSIPPIKDATPIQLSIVTENDGQVSLGNQYLLFIPFSSIEVPSMRQHLFIIAQRELSLRGFAPVLSPQANVEQGLALKLVYASVSAFDYFAFRRIRSDVTITGELFRAGAIKDSFTSSKNESIARQTAFAPQLERSLNNTTTAAINEILDELFPG